MWIPQLLITGYLYAGVDRRDAVGNFLNSLPVHRREIHDGLELRCMAVATSGQWFVRK